VSPCEHGNKPHSIKGVELLYPLSDYLHMKDLDDVGGGGGSSSRFPQYFE